MKRKAEAAITGISYKQQKQNFSRVGELIYQILVQLSTTEISIISRYAEQLQIYTEINIPDYCIMQIDTRNGAPIVLCQNKSGSFEIRALDDDFAFLFTCDMWHGYDAMFCCGSNNRIWFCSNDKITLLNDPRIVIDHSCQYGTGVFHIQEEHNQLIVVAHDGCYLHEINGRQYRKINMSQHDRIVSVNEKFIARWNGFHIEYYDYKNLGDFSHHVEVNLGSSVIHTLSICSESIMLLVTDTTAHCLKRYTLDGMFIDQVEITDQSILALHCSGRDFWITTGKRVIHGGF